MNITDSILEQRGFNKILNGAGDWWELHNKYRNYIRVYSSTDDDSNDSEVWLCEEDTAEDYSVVTLFNCKTPSDLDMAIKLFLSEDHKL